MATLSDFLAMGGYGGFIWPAYAAAAGVLVLMLIASWRGLRKAERELDRLQLRLPGRRGDGSARSSRGPA